MLLATKGITPQDFVNKMVEHWTNNLQNVTNKALQKTWHQVASVFANHIENHDDHERAKEWTVLSPPTGTGKSESIVVYCSMLSHREANDHPGVLVVTRLIDDCNAMAERINQFGVRPTAVAFHSGVNHKVNLSDLKSWPVVVITHRAYEMALDFLGHEGRIEQTWPFFHNYNREGKLPSGITGEYPGQNPFTSSRRLVIVDECLDIVEHYKVSLEELRRTLAAIPQEIRRGFDLDIKDIKAMIDVLEKIDSRTYETKPKERMLFARPAVETVERKVGRKLPAPDMSKLIKALREISFDEQLNRKDALERERLRRMHEIRLRSLHHVYRSWSFYSKHSKDQTIYTARLLIPEDTKGCVVFDATAHTNVIYELHKDSRSIDPPEGSRNYSNVTVHYSRVLRTGKTYMTKEAKKMSHQLIADLNGRLKGRDVFLVTHKAVEPIISKYDTTFQLRTGHWGAIDGSNKWKDCDTVVIFGLPFLPNEWSANVYMALQGPMDTEWLQDSNKRDFGKHSDIRSSLRNGHIVTCIIQAINRVRCRKTVDAQGNCESTDVFLMLPNGALSDSLLEAIRKMMPGIVIKADWDYAAKNKRVRSSKSEESVCKFLENVENGKYSPTNIAKQLEISTRTIRTLIKKAEDPESMINKVMKVNGVNYEVFGKGRNQQAFFIKY